MPDIFVGKEPDEPHQTQQLPRHTDDATASVDALMHSRRQPVGKFSAYCVHPTGISFANQESDEVILLFVRRHFITNLPWLFSTFILFSIPPLLFALSLLPALASFTLPLGLTIVITAFYYLVIIGYAFGNFISWFYNVGIVTQKRIMDLDSSNILTHNTTSAHINEVVDVKFTQQGFFQSFFNYGNVHIQTEALKANFDFTAAPKPTNVEDIISDLRVAERKGRDGISEYH